MIKVGTCGYSYYNPGEDWKEEYKSKLQAFSDEFECCEINKTFYKLPMVKTTKRWRKEVFDDFEFTMKAWQAITHPTSSPTWKEKQKEKLSESEKENYGWFKPNEEVIEAWKETKNRAKALDAEVIVFQTPPSFDCSQENIENLYGFFEKITRDNIKPAWEPRGNWKENKEVVRDVCNSLDLIHVVDLMREKPLSDSELCYFRLHGLNENKYNYDYDYSDQELDEIAKKLFKSDRNHEKIYCMFNNYNMYKNALDLFKKLKKREDV